MNHKRWSFAAAVAACLWLGPIASYGDDATDTTLTVYSSAEPGGIPPEWYRPVPGQSRSRTQVDLPGYAVVKQERTLDLEAGRNVVRFADVAALIDPTTVSFSSLTDPDGTHVLEQSFEFDLVDSDALMERYLDKRIVAEQVRGEHISTVEGTLLSTSGGLILQGADDSVQIIQGVVNVRFSELPGGLITRPTLVWDLSAQQPGTHRTRVAYQTTGMTWWADYNITFREGQDANRGVLDVGSWVSLINNCGTGFSNCTLKLVAGEVNRAPQPTVRRRGVQYAEALGVAAPGFEEQAFFEYHLYTLGRPTTLADRSTRQIELFPTAHDVPCDKLLLYDGQGRQHYRLSAPLTERSWSPQSNTKVEVLLRFKNSAENHMGMPLPAGRIRVNKLDPADGALEFIGEDAIDHTPRDETVSIRMGTAFDIVGERKQIEFNVDTARKKMEERIEIRVRNHKREAVQVVVQERGLRWSTWTCQDASHEFEKIDAQTVHFPVRVEADGEVVVRYTAGYRW